MSTGTERWTVHRVARDAAAPVVVELAHRVPIGSWWYVPFPEFTEMAWRNGAAPSHVDGTAARRALSLQPALFPGHRIPRWYVHETARASHRAAHLVHRHGGAPGAATVVVEIEAIYRRLVDADERLRALTSYRSWIARSLHGQPPSDAERRTPALHQLTARLAHTQYVRLVEPCGFDHQASLRHELALLDPLS